jgi:signal transduction histidine kinase
VAPDAGWTTLELYRTDRSGPTEISALALRLPRGEMLLVGRDVAARATFDRTLARALLWALVAIAALALATGWLVSRLVGSRVDEIGGAARDIMAGALDRRVALRGTGDEFDRLAGTLNAMLDRIEALVQGLRTVTDSLAHDLRSPLGRLIQHLEAATEEARPEVRQGRIARALTEAEAVLSTSTALLDLSRVEAGIGRDQFSAVALDGLAADVTELYAAAVEERGARIRCRAEPGAVVQGHEQLLAQALSNLVDNAIKHAPAGTDITVTACVDAGRPTLSVGDRGPGVPEADRERALSPFVRIDPGRGGSGAGLGLALVAAIARMHGCEIALSDNAPGLLATLRFPAPGAPAPLRLR